MSCRHFDLPSPGSPAMRAKPPSMTRFSSRKKNESIAGGNHSESTGKSAWKGFHFRPNKAKSFFIVHLLPHLSSSLGI